MKHTSLFFTVLSAVALITGCNKAETTSQRIDKVEEKTAATARDMKDYTFAQKAEFTAAMRSQLAEINKELDLLGAKIAKSSDAAKAAAEPKLQALREKAAQLGKRLDEAGTATESTWDSVKTASKQTYSDLKDGFNQSRQWLSEKIAP